jgi:transcriptional regulator with XRE-family HTH domain
MNQGKTRTRPAPQGVAVPYLRAWRMKNYLMPAQLAQRAGVSLSTVQHAETGSVVRLTTIVQLAKALDVTPDQLRFEEPDGVLA